MNGLDGRLSRNCTGTLPDTRLANWQGLMISLSDPEGSCPGELQTGDGTGLGAPSLLGRECDRSLRIGLDWIWRSRLVFFCLLFFSLPPVGVGLW